MFFTCLDHWSHVFQSSWVVIPFFLRKTTLKWRKLAKQWHTWVQQWTCSQHTRYKLQRPHVVTSQSNCKLFSLVFPWNPMESNGPILDWMIARFDRGENRYAGSAALNVGKLPCFCFCWPRSRTSKFGLNLLKYTSNSISARWLMDIDDINEYKWPTCYVFQWYSHLMCHLRWWAYVYIYIHTYTPTNHAQFDYFWAYTLKT